MQCTGVLARFTLHYWAGLKVWAHPPQEAIGSASTGQAQVTRHTLIIPVLPDWQEALRCFHFTQRGSQSWCGVLPRRVNPESVCASEHGMVLAIIGRTWGIGVCIP